MTYDTVVKRRLCFNSGHTGHRENKCCSRGCYKCKAKHHTSLCSKIEGNEASGDHNAILHGYSPSVEENSLAVIVPMKIHGVTFWAYLDTGSGKNFISKDAIKKLKLMPSCYETRHVVTMNGDKEQSVVDGQASESVEITGSKMWDFTTVKRPPLRELKEKYKHIEGKTFYRTASEEYPIYIILGDITYCKIRTTQVYKDQPEDPVVKGTIFGWVIHGGTDYSDTRCMYVKEVTEYERLYSLDVLGVEDRREDDPLTVYTEFQENINKRADGRYEVSVPWIPGAVLSNTNEEPSRRRLHTVERKLCQSEELRK